MATRSKILLDPALRDGRDTDIVIPIMGLTKAGKSSLVNQLVRWDQMRVGESLASCTESIQAAVVDQAPDSHGELNKALHGRRIIFLDTPGFDDTNLQDGDVLLRIVHWLEATYRRKMLVGAVLYLHAITRDSWSGACRRSLNLFYELCGEEALSQVFFVTTKWDDVPPTKVENFLQRAEELEHKWWKEMTGQGASVHRLRPPSSMMSPPTSSADSSQSSLIPGLQDPWDIIHTSVVAMNARDVAHRILRIQDEIVNQHLFFIESKAGKALRATFQEMLIRAKDMQNQVGRDPASLKEIQENVDDIIQRLSSLKPAIHKRLRRWLKRTFAGLSRSGAA